MESMPWSTQPFIELHKRPKLLWVITVPKHPSSLQWQGSAECDWNPRSKAHTAHVGAGKKLSQGFVHIPGPHPCTHPRPLPVHACVPSALRCCA